MCCFENLLSPPMYCHRLFWSLILWDYFWAIMSFEAATVYYYITLCDQRTRGVTCRMFMEWNCIFLCQKNSKFRRTLEFYLWIRYIFRHSFLSKMRYGLWWTWILHSVISFLLHPWMVMHEIPPYGINGVMDPVITTQNKTFQRLRSQKNFNFAMHTYYIFHLMT